MLVSAVRVTSTRSFASRSRSFASVVDAAGFKVAALDNGQPTSSVTVLVKAGSRYGSKAGVPHALKNFGFKNTTERSALRTVRESELYGGVLSSSLSREYLAYTAEFLRGDESHFVDVLCTILTSTRFTRYELEESVIPTIQAETIAAYSNPATHAIELAHALAFRSGLGNGLFATPKPHIAVSDVQDFAAAVFGKGNIVILGTGIGQDALAKLVQKNLSSVGEAIVSSSPTTTYYGGETRVPFSEDVEHARHTIFVGFGAADAWNAELAALAAYLSPASSLKWAPGMSPLSTALPDDTSAQTVFLPYSDATLFGLLVQGKTPEKVKEAGKVAVKALRDLASVGAIKAEDVKKAVAKARFLAASAAEGREGLVSTFGPKLLSGSQTSLDSTFASLDKVSVTAFTKAVTNVIKVKPTFVAVGDIHRLPFPDEVGL